MGTVKISSTDLDPPSIEELIEAFNEAWNPAYQRVTENNPILCVHTPVDTGIPGGRIWCKKCDVMLRWTGTTWMEQR